MIKKPKASSYWKILLFTLLCLFFYFVGLSRGNLKNIVKTPTPVNEQVTASNFCIRNTPYTLRPEFDRAISLIKQKFLAAGWSKAIDPSWLNCINIEYSPDVGSAEGVFVLDSQHFSRSEIKILVNKSYEAKDDLLTAILIAHELSHVKSAVYSTINGKSNIIDKDSCYEEEVQAFLAQWGLILNLSNEERNSLAGRFLLNPQDPVIASLVDSMALAAKAVKQCNNSFEGSCFFKKLQNYYESSVRDNPYYQQECSRFN